MDKEFITGQALASRNILAESQLEKFPYMINEFGLKLIVCQGVFSPTFFNGYNIFTKNFPSFEEESILEIGCGIGITGLYLAKNGAKKVVLIDINPNAVENTKENAFINKIINIDIRESDIFSAIKSDEQFDTIYWNMPFISISANYKFCSMLEKALFDPGYKITERFLKEAALYLKKRGRLIIGWGDSENNDFGNQDKLKYLAEQYNFSIKLLVQEQSTEQNPVTFQLYELKRILEKCKNFRRK